MNIARYIIRFLLFVYSGIEKPFLPYDPWVIGQSLLLHNYIAGLSGITTFGLMYLLRVGPEEKVVEATFGEEYVAYKARTRRLLPKL